MSPENPTKKNKKQSRKRELYQWLGLGAVIALLYFTGLHINVLGGMQRVMLYTGIFNAQIEPPEEEIHLNQVDFRFAMTTGDGDHTTLDNFSGKVTFINVWASWCPPCIAEMPSIETLYSNVEDHDDIRFILLSMDEHREDAVDFMEGYNLPYHFPSSGIPEPLQSSVLPTTYVISKEGEVVYKKEGIADYSSPEFSEFLQELSGS